MASSPFLLADDEEVTLTIVAEDTAGNPVPGGLSGTPTWANVDAPTSGTGAVVTLTVAADGMSCVVAATGELGNTTVTVDAVLADGVTSVTGAIQGTVGTDLATQIVIEAGTPTTIPPTS